MESRRIVLTLLGGLVALGGWGVAQGGEEAPRSLEARWQEAQNEGNLEAVAELFTEDARFSPFDGTTLEGIEAIRAFFNAEGGSPEGGPRIEISPEEHTVVGELAYGYGTYALRAPDGSQIAAGNYLGVYSQEGGEWRIHRYMGNAVMPEEAQGVAGNKALVRQMIESGSGQVKTEAALREHVPSEALIEHVKVLEAAFPRYEVFIDDLFAEGQKVAVRARLRGRHEGEFAGVAPTGKLVEAPFIALYELEGGKIAEFWIQADMMGLVQQLTGEN